MTAPRPLRPVPLRRSLAVAGLLGGAAALSALTTGDADATALPVVPMRVMVDPGHGGSDSGAVGNGLIEKELNLAVAQRLVELLELDTLDTSGGSEWDVRTTRNSDVFVSLSARSSAANAWPAEVFVSIHHNGFSLASANGTETFSYQNGTNSALLRDDLQDEQLLAFGLFNRGSKTGNFHVLRETNMPAALSEAGFLSSPIDAGVIGAPGFVEDSALAHLFALQRYRGVAPYEPSTAPTAYCNAKVSALGCLPSVGSIGEPSLSSSTPFRVTCHDVVSQQFGLAIWSTAEGSMPFYGGTLCLGGSLVRMPATYSNGFGAADCSGYLEQSFPGSYFGNLLFQPGDVLHVQFWFRDPHSPIPVGLSDALRFTLRP